MKTIFNLILLTAILFSTSCSMKYSMVKENGKMGIAQSVVPHLKPDKISEKRNMPDTAATATEIIKADSIHCSASKYVKTKQAIVSHTHQYVTYLNPTKTTKKEIASTGTKHYSKNAMFEGLGLDVAILFITTGILVVLGIVLLVFGHLLLDLVGLCLLVGAALIIRWFVREVNPRYW